MKFVLKQDRTPIAHFASTEEIDMLYEYLEELDYDGKDLSGKLTDLHNYLSASYSQALTDYFMANYITMLEGENEEELKSHYSYFNPLMQSLVSGLNSHEDGSSDHSIYYTYYGDTILYLPVGIIRNEINIIYSAMLIRCSVLS